MNKTVAQPSNSPAASRHMVGTFRNLWSVIGIAFVLATLFTAWTPSSLPQYDPAQFFASNPIFQPNPTPNNGPTATPRAHPLIGIVSGHWGNDSGAVCSDGLTEAQINQNIATLVQKYLVEEGYDVDVLHEFDPLLKGYQASALVSIHADSCDFINDGATGFKVAAALANPHPERATRLTACLRNRYARDTSLPLHSTSVTNDMTSYHAFGEIDENTTAAIIETGFLNLDRQFLTQHADQAARGIADGILCFVRNEDISSPTVQPSQ